MRTLKNYIANIRTTRESVEADLMKNPDYYGEKRWDYLLQQLGREHIGMLQIFTPAYIGTRRALRNAERKIKLKED